MTSSLRLDTDVTSLNGRTQTSKSSSVLDGATPGTSGPAVRTSASALMAAAAADSRARRWWREASCYSCMVAAGWSDASSGPLIPYIQRYYGINYTVVSMLFVGQMCGFLLASFANTLATERFGLGKVIATGGLIQAFGYIFLIPAFPFPVMPVSYAVVGFGMALQDAQANTYIAILPRADYKMGFLHAAYGAGALVCPLAATAFASSGIRFSFFYAISLGIASINTAILTYAFRFNYRIDTVEPAPSSPTDLEASDDGGLEDAIELRSFERPQPHSSAPRDKVGEGADVVASAEVANPAQAGAPKPVPMTAAVSRSSAAAAKKQKSTLQRTLMSRTVWVCATFILVYVGSEVSMGGWIVTFVLENRDGTASAGYIATGFWGGLTIGRAIATPLNNYVGEKRVLFIYLFLGVCLELAIWFADNLVGNAVTVALVGLIIGPIYPVTMSVCTKILPRSMHASGIGFIAAFGQVGSALFPFITGALAQRFSPAVLQPVMIILFSVQIVIWFFCPSPPRKRD